MFVKNNLDYCALVTILHKCRDTVTFTSIKNKVGHINKIVIKSLFLKSYFILPSLVLFCGIQLYREHRCTNISLSSLANYFCYISRKGTLVVLVMNC